MKLMLLASLACLAAACDTTSYCDFRMKGENRCQQRSGAPTSIATYEATCKSIPNAVYGTGGCPHAGSLGGCDLSEFANPIEDWYYPDPTNNFTTAADVMTACMGKPYLAP